MQINLTKELKDLYNGNNRILQKKTKKRLGDEKTSHIHRLSENSYTLQSNQQIKYNSH
jgi:hypothetical protein